MSDIRVSSAVSRRGFLPGYAKSNIVGFVSCLCFCERPWRMRTKPGAPHQAAPTNISAAQIRGEKKTCWRLAGDAGLEDAPTL